MTALVLDDDCSLRDVLRALLIEIGYRAVGFVSIADASRTRRSLHADLIVLDLVAHGSEPIRRELAASCPDASVVAVCDGNYEAILARVFTRMCVDRRHGATSRRRASSL